MTHWSRAVRRALVAGAAVALAGALLSSAIGAGSRPLWPWNDAVLVAGLFAAAYVIASLVGFVGVAHRDGRDAGRVRPPEEAPPVPRPGVTYERILDSRLPVALGPARRRRVRSGLRRAAARSVATHDGSHLQRARVAIRRGDWTDDPVAAAFLREDDAAESSALERLVARLRFRRHARRTARVVRSLPSEEEEEECQS